MATLPWSDVHWPTLVAQASWERAASPLSRLLRAVPAGGVPADALQAVHNLSRVAEFRAGELAQAAAESVDALERAGLAPLWLKGAALAMQSPRGFGIRAMGDLDLLVGTAELDAARAALLTGGWQQGAVTGGYDRHHHLAPLVRRADLRLELHDAVLPPGHPFSGAGAERWMAAAVRADWQGREVRVLAPAWHVTHAALHWAWSHEGSVGTWQFLHDMHRFAASDLDWDEVAAVARLVGGAPVVGMALWSAVHLGGVAVPKSVIGALRGRPRASDGIAERTWVLRALHSPMPSPSVRWSRFWWRQAVRGIGDATRSWPWTVGRAAVAAPAVGAAPMGSGRARLARWGRHLGRVLGG